MFFFEMQMWKEPSCPSVDDVGKPDVLCTGYRILAIERTTTWTSYNTGLVSYNTEEPGNIGLLKSSHS